MSWSHRWRKPTIVAMDFYASPMSCSFALHVACLEAGLPFTIRWVARAGKRLEDGRDYLSLAPKGVVPALVLDDGSLLTETAAVLQQVADRVPGLGLAPAWGSAERYRLIEWINFVSSELHGKHLAPMFGLTVPDPVKNRARASIGQPLAVIARALEGREVLIGDRFTVADAYLFWALFVAPHGGAPLDAWPALTAYVERHRMRASIKSALAVEGPRYLKETQAAA
jgi:glutathione S-transferase